MKRLATVITALSLMLLPSVALANSTCQQYNNCTTPTVSQTTAGTTASTLPFTGLDVVLLLAGGGTLLGAGLVVRRLSRGTEH